MYEKLLDRILEQLNQLLPHDVADILLVKQGMVRSVRWRGYEKFGLEDSIPTFTYNLVDTANLRTIRETGRPLAIPNVEQFEQWVTRPGLDWIKSQASAPICIGDRVIGFLNINSATPGLYTQADAERLQTFADHTAVTLENARLRSQTRSVVFERQKTEKTLQETLVQVERAKREWETTVDSLSQLICLLDRQGRVLRANRTVARWGLAQVTRVKGREFHDLLHPGCIDRNCYLKALWPQSLEKLVEGHSVEREAEDEILKRHLHFQIRPISAPQVGENNGAATNFAVAVINDITIRKRTEEELHRIQARNQALLNAIPDLMLQISRDGTFLNFVSAKDIVLPLSPEEFLGKKVSEVFPSKGAEATIFYVEQALQTNETQIFEYQLLVDDQMRDFEFRLVASGEDEVLSIVRDITARKQAEKELKRYQDQLEEIIEERSVALMRANEQLQQEVDERRQVEEQLRRRNQELALLNHIVVAVSAGLGLETVLETTCRELALAIDLPQACALLLDENRTEGKVVAKFEVEGQAVTALPDLILVESSAALKHLLKHKTPLVVDNARVHSDPHLVPVYNMLLQQRTASLLMLPLFIEDEVAGSLSVASPEPHHFSEEEINLAQVVANQVSQALAQTCSEQ